MCKLVFNALIVCQLLVPAYTRRYFLFPDILSTISHFHIYFTSIILELLSQRASTVMSLVCSISHISSIYKELPLFNDFTTPIKS